MNKVYAYTSSDKIGASRFHDLESQIESMGYKHVDGEFGGGVPHGINLSFYFTNPLLQSLVNDLIAAAILKVVSILWKWARKDPKTKINATAFFTFKSLIKRKSFTVSLEINRSYTKEEIKRIVKKAKKQKQD